MLRSRYAIELSRASLSTRDGTEARKPACCRLPRGTLQLAAIPMGYGARQIVLFDRENFDRLYNCTAYNVDDVPLERRQDPILGACYILLFSFYEVAIISA